MLHNSLPNQVWARGSRLTSIQYGVACGKNRMNSLFIFKSKLNTLDRWFDSILSL